MLLKEIPCLHHFLFEETPESFLRWMQKRRKRRMERTIEKSRRIEELRIWKEVKRVKNCADVWLLGLEMEKRNNLNDVENKIFIYLMNDEGLKWMSEMKWKFKEIWLFLKGFEKRKLIKMIFKKKRNWIFLIKK